MYRHVVNNVFEAIEAMSVALGPGVVMSYTLSGLAHPARKIREYVLHSLYP